MLTYSSALGCILHTWTLLSYRLQFYCAYNLFLFYTFFTFYVFVSFLLVSFSVLLCNCYSAALKLLLLLFLNHDIKTKYYKLMSCSHISSSKNLPEYLLKSIIHHHNFHNFKRTALPGRGLDHRQAPYKKNAEFLTQRQINLRSDIHKRRTKLAVHRMKVR